MIALDLALVGVAPLDEGVWATDLDDGLDPVAGAAADVDGAVEAAAAVIELRLSTVLLVMDLLLVTLPP